MRRIHGLAVTSLLAGLLGLVLVVLVLPASAVPVPASYLILYRQGHGRPRRAHAAKGHAPGHVVAHGRRHSHRGRTPPKRKRK